MCENIQRIHSFLDTFAANTERELFLNRCAPRRLAEQIVEMQQAQRPYGIPARVLEFMLFYVGPRALAAAVAEREWSAAGDWVAWSLSDRPMGRTWRRPFLVTPDTMKRSAIWTSPEAYRLTAGASKCGWSCGAGCYR